MWAEQFVVVSWLVPAAVYSDLVILDCLSLHCAQHLVCNIVCCLHSRHGQLAGRLPQLAAPGSRGMVCTSGTVSEPCVLGEGPWMWTIWPPDLTIKWTGLSPSAENLWWKKWMLWWLCGISTSLSMPMKCIPHLLHSINSFSFPLRCFWF